MTAVFLLKGHFSRDGTPNFKFWRAKPDVIFGQRTLISITKRPFPCKLTGHPPMVLT